MVSVGSTAGVHLGTGRVIQMSAWTELQTATLWTAQPSHNLRCTSHCSCANRQACSLTHLHQQLLVGSAPHNAGNHPTCCLCGGHSSVSCPSC